MVIRIFTYGVIVDFDFLHIVASVADVTKAIKGNV